MRKYAVLALIVILALMMSGCALFSPAPPTKAILEGRVLVPERAVRQVGGQPLPGATVRVKDLEGNIVATTTTDANGYYRVEVPAGGPYIIEVVKGSIKVLRVSPQVEVGKTYDLGTADATSTAVALVFQAKVEAGEDPAEIDLDELAEDPKIKEELAQAIEEALAAGEDPTTAPEVIHLVEVIVTPPAPAPEPDTTPPTLKSLTAYLDPSGTRKAKIVGGKWTLEWTVGEKVTKIEAIASEPVKLLEEANAVVRMSGEGKVPDTNESKIIQDVVYGTIRVDETDPTKTRLIITPNPGNKTAALAGTFTFTVAAGVVEDLAGNKNAEISVILKVGAPVYNKTQGKYYTTIQEAVNEAADDNTIIVAAGTYTENVTIGKPLTITGATGGGATTIKGTVTIESGGGGTKIENINFELGTTTDPNTTDNIVLNKDVSNITINKCNFDAENRFMGEPHARAIQMKGTCDNIKITNCTFKNGYYVTIQGRANNVTVTNSRIENCKSGINLQAGNNLTVYNTDISVVAQGESNDTYCVRFASDAESGSNMSITGGKFSVNKGTFTAGENTYHSAIVIRSKATGTMDVWGVHIIGEVVNLSATPLYARGNRWGIGGSSVPEEDQIIENPGKIIYQ